MTTITLTDAITSAIGPLDSWAHKCHQASHALVQSGVLADAGLGHPGRVARGACTGVGGQHSWVVVGPDVYDRTALIVDVTLWSYDPTADRVWTGTMLEDRRHTPHGSRSIWAWGKPQHAGGVTVPLDSSELSDSARDFLDLIGPLDSTGWAALWSSGSMQGWASREILDAFLDQHPTLAGIVPVDMIGHLTDRNPGGLYF